MSELVTKPSAANGEKPLLYCPLCHSPRCREYDRLIIDSKTPFSAIALEARYSRRTVTRHSKHLVETYHEPRLPVINYAPNINLVVLDRGQQEQEDKVPDEPRRCSICTHRHVALIDEELVKSVSYQRLATEFGVSAEARIRKSILRKARGQEWRYEGREQDLPGSNVGIRNAARR
jgi:hypothetical protein